MNLLGIQLQPTTKYTAQVSLAHPR